MVVASLLACGRMNPMNPSYEWTGETWADGADTGDAVDLGLSAEDTGL